MASMPGNELWHDGRRSGIGRFSRRVDLAALCVVMVAGAFTNAALMTGPVVDLENRLMSTTRLGSSMLVTTGLCLLALVVLPFLIVAAAAVLSRSWGQTGESLTAVAAKFAYALVPMGFGMWLAHYSFHFFTSYQGVVPTMQRFLADRGWGVFGSPDWTCAACVPAASWLLRLEIVFLDLGLLLSLYTAYRISRLQGHRSPRPVRAFAPWAILIAILFTLGIWIVFQPMEMRGTMQMMR
jgi:hypothetical protein